MLSETGLIQPSTVWGIIVCAVAVAGVILYFVGNDNDKGE